MSTPVRVSIGGFPRSGNTTLGRADGPPLLPYTKLGAICHQARCNDQPDDEFRARVATVAGDAWVVDGDDRVLPPLVLARATTVFSLDYGFRDVSIEPLGVYRPNTTAAHDAHQIDEPRLHEFVRPPARRSPPTTCEVVRSTVKAAGPHGSVPRQRV